MKGEILGIPESYKENKWKRDKAKEKEWWKKRWRVIKEAERKRDEIKVIKGVSIEEYDYDLNASVRKESRVGNGRKKK